jgi:hypothetical protein
VYRVLPRGSTASSPPQLDPRFVDIVRRGPTRIRRVQQALGQRLLDEMRRRGLGSSPRRRLLPALGAVRRVDLTTLLVSPNPLDAATPWSQARTVSGPALLTEGEVKTLQGILPCIKSVEKGIDEKPTVQFHGCNVQIVNGEGATETTNGAGNLVIGYDELRETGVNEFAPQTGSHNLVVGISQSFTTYGGLLAGVANTLSAPWTSVSGGIGNTASGSFASVSGGIGNTASGLNASVSGGVDNVASGFQASVSGGDENTAAAEYSSISGGVKNLIPHNGHQLQWIGGGQENEAAGNRSAIFGGKGNTATGEFEAIP